MKAKPSSANSRIVVTQERLDDMLVSTCVVVADHPVLRTLEVRTSDKAAQDFVRRQRARMAE